MFFIFAIVLGFVLFEIAWLKFYGSVVPKPDIPRGQQIVGGGDELRYMLLGDSTVIAQGGDYKQGYAVATAAHLAKKYRVTWENIAVSGSRAKDVLEKQIPQAVAARPDVVLIAVGANDVTHLTNIDEAYGALKTSVQKLQAANKDVRIVFTGSPDMGSLTRLPQPLRWLAGEQTKRLNKKLQTLAQDPKIVFAPIAEKTGPVFRANPKLLAADHFHATTEGYNLWTPVLIDALNRTDLKK